jgi:putative tricarboxylic transport membrane protein
MCGGALVPMLSFGIPGDATTAVVIGVLLIHGLVPGPRLLQVQFYLIAPMVAALVVCAALLIVPSLILLGPYYIKFVRINRAVLYSFIAVVAIVGAYVATYDIFQMGMALLAGVMAYFLRKTGYPTVPLLLGFILGPMAELYLRRSLQISGGNPVIFFTSLPSIVFLLLTVIFVYFLAVRPWLRSRGGKKVEGEEHT